MPEPRPRMPMTDVVAAEILAEAGCRDLARAADPDMRRARQRRRRLRRLERGGERRMPVPSPVVLLVGAGDDIQQRPGPAASGR